MKSTITIFLLIITSLFYFCNPVAKNEHAPIAVVTDTVPAKAEVWQAPDTATIPHDEFGAMVRYGRDLIVNTAYYIGPNGTVSKNLSNKMNCTHCHLEAGTKPYAFNYLSTHARYPQFRARENRILSLAERVNNCIERPHSGKPLPLDSKEMTAIVCYIKWLGQNVPVGGHVEGDSPLVMDLMDRAADPVKGEEIYKRECMACHGPNGEGQMKMDETCYEYPPLWGPKSYQHGSSLHRVVKAAAFIYANMPNKNSTYLNPKLTLEEAYDVAAFVNDDRIHKRPVSHDAVNYPNTLVKSLDYGNGPFIDSFPDLQHKFGPWKPIVAYRKKHDLPANF